jgi:hypothetical protein
MTPFFDFHEDDGGAVSYGTVTCIYYLTKDNMINGGDLEFKIIKNINKIDIESNMLVIFTGDLTTTCCVSASMLFSTGTASSNCICGTLRVQNDICSTTSICASNIIASSNLCSSNFFEVFSLSVLIYSIFKLSFFLFLLIF